MSGWGWGSLHSVNNARRLLRFHMEALAFSLPSLSSLQQSGTPSLGPNWAVVIYRALLNHFLQPEEKHIHIHIDTQWLNPIMTLDHFHSLTANEASGSGRPHIHFIILYGHQFTLAYTMFSWMETNWSDASQINKQICFFNKCIFLCSKDVLNWSKLPVKNIILLQNM